MAKYNHAFAFAFSLVNDSESGNETTAKELRQAIINHLSNVSDTELVENCGMPFDTYTEELENA